MKLNEELIIKLKEVEKELRNERRSLADAFKSLKGTEGYAEKSAKIINEVSNLDHMIVMIRDTVSNARKAYEAYKNNNTSANQQNLIDANRKLENLANHFGIEVKTNMVEEPKAEESKKEKSTEKKKHTVRNVICGVLAASALTGIGYAIGSASKTKNAESEKEEVLLIDDEKNNESSKPFESYGTFTDASNTKQVEQRAQWYMDTYFNEAFKNLSNVGSETANKETLADGIRVVSGERTIYQDFETDDLLRYNNGLVQMFCSYLTLNGSQKAGFVPSQYLYEDGSYEQKCAAQVDAILEPLIEAINKKDNDSYVKYAKSFGELMRDQYLNVDFTDNSYNVRGMADFSSQIHLYSLAYAEYTNKIMPYGLDNGLDICIPICVDYSTGETIEYPLSKLMATLEFVPTSQWDAVIARSGYTAKDLENLGNNSTEDTMPVTFTINAKEHYREQNLKLKK